MVRQKVTYLLLVLWLQLSATSLVLVAGDYRNVYGEELQTCSRPGTAITGYTRNGRCVAHEGDAGSHHICIHLSSLTTGTGGGNFCQVTGQPDWCSSQTMACHDDSPSNNNNNKKKKCAIQNWCVCQWAFARYIERAGGCDHIQDIVCESINMEALKAYKKTASSQESSKAALECLERRCNLKGTSQPEPLEEPTQQPHDSHNEEL